MLLKELVDQLVYGELSTLPLGTTDVNGDLVDGFNAIIPHINLALTSVHKRLYLREESLLLRQSASIKKYFIQDKFAESNVMSSEPVKYIIDAASPYLGNSLKVESIHNAAGDTLPVNDSSADMVLRTPTPNSILIAAPVANQDLTITYRANHPHIDVSTMDSATQEIDIPDFVLEPLLYFIASRVHASYPPALEATNESYNYRNKYEAAMAEISEYGLVDTSSNSNRRLETAGWV
jgi:hypothetical protein